MSDKVPPQCQYGCCDSQANENEKPETTFQGRTARRSKKIDPPEQEQGIPVPLPHPDLFEVPGVTFEGTKPSKQSEEKQDTLAQLKHPDLFELPGEEDESTTPSKFAMCNPDALVRLCGSEFLDLPDGADGAADGKTQLKPLKEKQESPVRLYGPDLFHGPDEASESEKDSAASPESKISAFELVPEPRRDSHHGSNTSVTVNESPKSKANIVFSIIPEAPIPGCAKVTVPGRTCFCTDCKPELYLQTVHAYELQRFQPWRDTLSLFQHNSLQLSELAIGSFNRKFLDPKPVAKTKSAWRKTLDLAPGILSRAQIHAMQAWKHWIHDKTVRQNWRKSLDLSEYNADFILQSPIKIFNTLFFLGELPVEEACDDLSVQWWPPEYKRRAQTCTATEEGDQKAARPCLTTIWINPQHAAHRLNIKGLMNTLLHELCHAFLQRHSCYGGNGEGCDYNPVCLHLGKENYGATSHGRAWQMLAAAIEEAAPKLLDGWQVDLGRCEGAVQEISRVGMGWWPTKCDLERLGDDLGWKVKALMRSRDDDVVSFGKVRSWVLKEPGCPSATKANLKQESSCFPKQRSPRESS